MRRKHKKLGAEKEGFHAKSSLGPSIMEAILAEYFRDDDDSCVEKAKKIASTIQCGECSILQLTEGMHCQLTSKDSEKRLKSLQLIAKVLSYMNEDCLTSNQCLVLSEYLCCRLEDHFSLHPPTLNAIVTLSMRSDLGGINAEKVVRTIFKEVHVQSYMQSERYAVYEIISNLTDGYSTELKEIGNDYVYGVITAVDGEQDPRNLLKVFELMHSVIKHGFNVTKFAEEYFDVVGCYFPIDFEPPSNVSGNKAIVTNGQLVKGLRKVLTSSQIFAPYLFPLVIEKIDSDVLSAKVDALETLQESLKVFSSVSLSLYLKPIWVSLHKEAVEGVSKDTEELTMSLIKDIVNVLSKTSQSRDEAVLEKFLQEMIQTCLPCITKNLQEKNVWSSGKLLIAAAEGSIHACSKIVAALLPVLLKLLDNKQAMIAEKRLAMELIVCCLKAVSMHNFTEHKESNPVMETKAKIMEVFCNSASSKEFLHLRTVALAGIAAMCNLGALISPDDESTIACVLVYSMQHEADDMIYKDLLITVGFLASKLPDVALKHILPVLKDALSCNSNFDEKVTKKYLDGLCALSMNFEVSSVTCGFLIEKVSMDNIDEKSATLMLSYLDAILTVVKQNLEDEECRDYFCSILVLPLISNCVELSLATTLPKQCCMACSGLETSPKECITWPIMERVSEIIRVISQKLTSKDKIDWICGILATVFINTDLSNLRIPPTATISFNPFHNTMMPLQTRLTTLLMSTFPVLISDAGCHVPDLMKNLLQLCLETTDQHSYVSASKCLAGLLNKRPDEEILNMIYDEGSHRISSNDLETEEQVATLCLIVWVTKALVICCHSYSAKYCEILFSLFGHEKLGKMAADSFDILFRQPEDILNEQCHACIRLMHKQWFFQLVLPRLKEGFQSINEQQRLDMDVDDVEDRYQHKKANYLTALSHLLHHLPKQVLNQHLQSLLPLLVKSLSSNEGPLLVSVLSTIHNLMEDAKLSLVPHVNMLIDRFLQLASFKANVHVRTQSLKCVRNMTLLPTDAVLPLKRRVVRELTAALDDKKRTVRKEAVKARTDWCLLGDV